MCLDTFQVKLDVSNALECLTVEDNDIAESILPVCLQRQDNEDHFPVLTEEQLVV